MARSTPDSQAPRHNHLLAALPANLTSISTQALMALPGFPADRPEQARERSRRSWPGTDPC